MAKLTTEINKSQAIRNYFKQNPKSTAKEVVTALAENGMTVTEGHVYVVKGKMKAKKGRKATGTTKMAKSQDPDAAPSKSSAVRSLLKENRKLTAKEVVAALSDKGIWVTEGLVYFVKGKMKGQRGRKKKARQVAAQGVTVAVSANKDTVKTILRVKGWAAEVGSMKKLKSLVDALSE